MVFKKVRKKIKGVVFRKSAGDDPEQLTIEVIKRSGKFDRKWYLNENPDVASNPYWSENPELHYYKLGSIEGRNPCIWFDTEWYLAQNEDITNAGMNPFVHYIVHGSREGRLPNPNKVSFKKNNTSSKMWQIRRRLSAHLWGGHSFSALAELNGIKNNSKVKASERWLAAWHKARWYYFLGDFNKAYTLALEMDDIFPENQWLLESVYLKAFCLFSFGESSEAANILKTYLKMNPADVDAYFALANAYMEDDAKRLELINKVYSSRGFTTLDLKDKSKLLTFDNVTTKPSVPVMEQQKISVIIPAYQAEDKLHIAVDSLLNQTWRNLEIVIVDDCSPDNTFEIAKSYASKDHRVKAIKQEKNSGAYPARNLGLKHVSGDFITTHDSDDWSHPQKLETQMRFFNEHPEKVGICAYWIRANHDLFFTQNWRPNNSLSHWSHSSFIFRKKAYEELGGWNNVRVGGDTEFIWRIKSKYGNDSYSLIDVQTPMALALDDEGSLTRTKMTHVKTVYFGLRHIYRECCAWAHRKQLGDNSNAGSVDVSYPKFPSTMVNRKRSVIKLDVLFVSDFSDRDMSAPILELTGRLHSKGKSVGLFHWPNFNYAPKALADEYFECLMENKAIPVVSGEDVESDFVISASCALLKYPVDQTPTVQNCDSAIVLSNKESEKQSFSKYLGNSLGKTASVASITEVNKLLSFPESFKDANK